MSFTEDDSSWDTDVVLNSNMISGFAPRHNLDASHMEKEMLLACQRSMMFNNGSNGSALSAYDDDDTNSSMSSFMSDDKYSLDDPVSHPNALDDFMYNTVPPLNFDSSQLPGVVRRLGGRNNRTEDDGDWASDISFSPSILLKPTHQQSRIAKENEYYSNLTIDDNEVTLNNDSTPSASKVPKPKEPASFVIVPENFEDANDLSELEVSDRFNTSPLSNMKRKLQLAESSQQQVASTCSLLDRIEKEQDEEDFCKDLVLNDGVFTQKLPTSSSSTKKKTITTPAVQQPQSKKSSTCRQTKSRFLSGTIASRQREMTVAAERMNRSKSSDMVKNVESKSLSLRKKTILKQAANEIPPAKRTSPTGTTLITRPLGKPVYTSHSRLDTLDNLVDVKQKRPLTVKKVVIKPPTVDPQRPWRNNMTKRQPVLIQPHQNPTKKVIDNMVYDKNQGLWKGNETVLKDFKPTVRRKPLLISNKQMNKPGAAASKYTSATVNGMVFKEDSLQWVNLNGEAEDTALDDIQDLEITVDHRPHNILSDFVISNTKKQEMIKSEKKHIDYMMYWPIAKNEKMVMTRSGHKVSASKYMLF